jgi:hypothetical protein
VFTRAGSVAGALGVAVLVALGTVRATIPAQTSSCPAQPTPAVSAQIPADVCIPDGLTGLAVDQFDDYSWRVFLALVWPAEPGRRGVAAATRGIGGNGPRVFETYKTLPEIFHRDGSPPEPGFDRYDTAAHSPCGVAASFGDVVIGSHSGIDDIGQAGIGELDGPVVAQNGRYIRTLTLFNEIQFDHIVRHRLFRRDQLPAVPSPRPDRPVLEFPSGSIAVKTAWIDVTGLAPALVKRMYTRPALVKNAADGGCTQTTVGLIGMHIAQKTPSRPQWIWSSFEQRDTVPPKWPDWPGAYVLNDNTSAPMPPRNPLSLEPLAPEPARPFNVTRHEAAPILTATELTSYAYRRLLAGTPWEFYRLVVTQWPRQEGNQALPISPTRDGGITNTFPGEGAFSAFTNVTMETFDQHGVQLGCMSCHNRVRMPADFMWTVLDHAYPSRLRIAPRDR